MKIYHYIITLLFLMVISSCSKDLGNYEYTDINELKIAGVNSEYSVRTTIDTLRIKADIAATMDQSDTSRYRYLWILKMEGKITDTIGRHKDLEYPVHVDPKTYDLFYRVLDKVTGVTWTANIKLTVVTPYSRGLLIMGEDEQGNAEAEMLSMLSDTVHIKGILSKSGLPPLRGPVSFLYTGGYDIHTKLWAFTESGSYYLDRALLTATTNNNFSRMIYVSETLNPETLNPVVFAPQLISVEGKVGNDLYRAMITKGGDVFASVPLLSGGDFFNNPVNRLATAPDVRLPAAPYLLYSIGNGSTFMWYDTKNQRFLNITAPGTGTTSQVMADEATDFFPWNQPIGRTLVYAENTRNSSLGSANGDSFAIMKDADNTHHIYQFYATGNPVKRGAYLVKSMATDFDKANFYAFSSNRSVVFYAVGNKLYAYDYNPGHEKSYQFPKLGNDEITMLKFDTQIDYIINSLYVATYNSSTKGTLQRFKVGADPNIVELLPQKNSSWSDMVKIKDVNWRAIN